jgi:hypothetical protein
LNYLLIFDHIHIQINECSIAINVKPAFLRPCASTAIYEFGCKIQRKEGEMYLKRKKSTTKAFVFA